MLGQRVVTAVVLLALLLPALFAASAWPFAALTLVLVAAAGWEWGRLNQMSAAGAWLAGALLAAACAAAWLVGWTEHAPAAVWVAAVLVWVVGGAVALRSGPARWPQLPRGLRWGLGLLALWAAWLAIAHARVIGVNFVLSVFCVVWMADIAAYFGGRALGRRKLAPSISPGKSWEGVWSGMAGVMLLGLVWSLAERAWGGSGPSLFSGLHLLYGVAGAALALALLAGMSVVGDLVESLVKRAAGAKDSSGLLPGHGGVLDRIDALLPVFPLALALTRI
jgi:phosphatidate cytidylyltransferase